MADSENSSANWKSWLEKDKLHRKSDVEGFGNILLADKAHDVFSISAEFGFGKTFFCEGLKAYLECNGAKCIFYNAWKSDFFENPLIPVISVIEQEFEKDAGKKIKKLKESGYRLLKSLSFNTPFVSITPSDVCTENNPFSEYDNYLKAISDIKSTLEEVVLSEDKALIIIVDELDRCRPDYAVKTLEIIKHFFNVNGVKFVLSIDENQIKSSVRHLYGTENFDGYIRKFVNYRFHLPKAEKAEYIDFLLENLGIKARLEREIYINVMAETLKTWSYFFDFSFRKIYQIVCRIDLRLKSLTLKSEEYYFLIATIACLIEFNKDFFEKIKNKKKYRFDDLQKLHENLVSERYLFSDYDSTCKKFANETLWKECSNRVGKRMIQCMEDDYFEEHFLPEAQKMEFLKLLDVPDSE